jgi:transcriptional regulator with XRE-family HTH domain
MARTALNLGVRDLAKLAKVGVATVARFEAGEDVAMPPLKRLSALSKKRASSSSRRTAAAPA